MVSDSNGIRIHNLLIRKRTLNHLGMTLLNAISLNMFQNKIKISPLVLPTSLAEHLQILIKMCFICLNKRISDNDTYSDSFIGRCEMDCAKGRVNERSINVIKLTRAVDFLKPREDLYFL